MRKQFGARPSKLDLEKWKEAVERFVEKAASENLNFIVPEMGEYCLILKAVIILNYGIKIICKF